MAEDLDAKITRLEQENADMLELVQHLYAALEQVNEKIDEVEKLKMPAPELGWHVMISKEFRDRLRESRITFIDFCNLTKKKARKLGIKDVDKLLKIRWELRENTIRSAAQRLWENRVDDADPPEHYWYAAEKFLGLNPLSAPAAS